MKTDSAYEREVAHSLIDALPEEKLSAVRNLLQVMVEPAERGLANAPFEDEKITEETSAELSKARASLAAGKGIPHEEILREFGL